MPYEDPFALYLAAKTTVDARNLDLLARARGEGGQHHA
jgi:hypothetical protein